ncbi:MAG: hypothetical protein O7B35_08295 [Deltaproteobacteria bacterium]|nr:hypothetical protein [Deltaproteobacteria bacterium]
MANNSEKQTEKILRGYLSQQRQIKERVGCPDEESLGGYLGGNLRGKAKEELEAHLAGCSFCVDEVVAAHKAMEEVGTETVPRQLMERVMALFPQLQGEQDFLDLEIRLAGASLELVSTTGRWIDTLGTEPVAVRGRSESCETGLLQVETEMGRFNIAVDVERVETGLCDVVVGIKGEEGKPVDGVRVGLVSGVRELASYLTRQGKAVFDRVSQGKYNLPIYDSGALVGTIRLSIG